MTVTTLVRLVCVFACALTLSCASSTAARPSVVDSRLDGPNIGNVREQFEEAKNADPTLMMGFYTAPWVDDFASLSNPEQIETGHNRDLLTSLQRSVEPDSWELPGRQLFRDGGWLVAFQTEDVLQQIPGALQTIQQEQVEARGLITTSVRIVRINETHPLLSEILAGRIDPIDDRIVPYFLSDEQAAKLVEASETITAPRLTLIAGQRGSVTIGNERAYVADYEVYYRNDQKVADPVIRTLVSGVSATIKTSKGDEELDRLDSEVSVSVAELISIKEAEIEVADRWVTVELPVVNIRTVESHFECTSDQVAMIHSRSKEGESLLVLLKSTPN